MARGIERVPIPPPIDSDETVRAIAKILTLSSRYKRLSTEIRAQVAGLVPLLEPWGVSEDAVRMALSLTHTAGGNPRGTEHVPNARLPFDGNTRTDVVEAARNTEVYMRSTYLANAAKRLQRDLNAGKTQREALRKEAVYYRAHEKARKGRLHAAAQNQIAGKMFGWEEERGVLVGWYHNPLLNNDAECLAASGHNFYLNEGTIIGLPGTVHPNCGCYAGPPHIGAGMVNDALSNLIRIQRTKPLFKLKSGKRRRAVS